VKNRNAADPTQVKEQSQKEKRGREKELDDVKFILSHRQGRRFYFRYLEECGVFKTSFTGNSQTFFLEGQRNIGLKLLSDLNEAEPEAYIVMIKENKGEIDV
jgi:hypothetical protein